MGNTVACKNVKEDFIGKYVCVENCTHRYNKHCDKYYFKIGDVFEYKYKYGAVYPEGIWLITEKGNIRYNGAVKPEFIDKYFLIKEEYETLLKVDQWFDTLLHTNVKIKNIKKQEGKVEIENEDSH